jgi:hypothetical protein
MTEQEPDSPPEEPPREHAAGESTTAGDRSEPRPAPACDLCGSGMVEHHCKLVCMNCGYIRDCSDP